MPDSFPSFTKTVHHDTYASISPTNPSLSYANKTILITGAGTGIGQATAIAFAQAGAKTIVLCGRRLPPLDETKSHIEKLTLNPDLCPGPKIIIQKLDITCANEVENVFENVKGNAGFVDVVVNSAGHLAERIASIGDVGVDEFWSSFEGNVRGAFLLARAYVRHLESCPTANVSMGQGSGEVVASGGTDKNDQKDKDKDIDKCQKVEHPDRCLIFFNSFIAHLPASQVATAPASYAISKLAQAKLAEYVADQYASRNVRCYAVQPGIVATEMNERSIQMTPDPEATRAAITWDQPELPAHFTLWLASQKGRCVPSGKYLWVNWDVDELEERREELFDNPHVLGIGLGGWPFD